MPCSGPRAPLAFALLVEGCGDGQSVGIEFDHAVDGRPAPVDFFDPGHVFLREGLSVNFPDVMRRLEICDGEFVELEASDFGRDGRGGRHLAGAGQRRQQGGADSADRQKSARIDGGTEPHQREVCCPVCAKRFSFLKLSKREAEL